MPLQNRVTPFGDIVALTGRGSFMGNRGVLHDAQRRIVRPWSGKRWITCLLQFRGRHRTVMQPRSYTELFFLDEATALSAGHRPCAECRRADYERFRSAWEACFGRRAGADEMDAVLHESRLDPRRKRTYRERLGALPDGTFVAFGGVAWLVSGDALLRWTDAGYTDRRSKNDRELADVLTPEPIVAVLKAGYHV